MAPSAHAKAPTPAGAETTVRTPRTSEQETVAPQFAADPAQLTVASAGLLQKSVGNQAVAQLLQRSPARTELRKGSSCGCGSCASCTGSAKTLGDEATQSAEPTVARAEAPAQDESEPPQEPPLEAEEDEGGGAAGDEEDQGGEEEEAEESAEPATAKKVGNEEELKKVAEPAIAKKVGNEEELKKVAGVAVVGSQRPYEGVTSAPAALMKAWTWRIKKDAAATIPLGAGDYGLTYPERVGVSFSAKRDKANNTWKAKANWLTGHYSMQTRLLPGQQEIGGPTGNTAVGNYDAQAQNLISLGNTPGNPWYMINAVKRHERVHATRFRPAMGDAAAQITADFDAITVPHVAGMNRWTAKAQLKALPAFANAKVAANTHWLNAILVRVAGDHAPGGPTDSAEKITTRWMLWKIRMYRKLRGWPATANCP